MSLVLTPLSEPIGVEATGIDLSQPIAAPDRDRLESALTERLVLVVRDQALTPQALLAAMRLFGPIKQQHLTDLLMADHPEIAVLDSREVKTGGDGRRVPIGARDWHTDHAHQAQPPNYTGLYAVELPSSGGDTGFANMQMAFAKLPLDRQAELKAMHVVTKIDDRYSSAADRAKHQASRAHPLVRTHPITGRPAIFVHPGMVDRVGDMSSEASARFIERLLAETITPDVSYRHVWRPGDLVIMDNRGQMHVAHTNYDLAEGRRLYRVLVEGEAPF